MDGTQGQSWGVNSGPATHSESSPLSPRPLESLQRPVRTPHPVAGGRREIDSASTLLVEALSLWRL